MQKLWLITILILVGACSKPTQPTEVVAAATESHQEVTATMPPGFTDAPPPPPTSSTIILSGGELIAETTIEDSVVVLSRGKILTWGKRGDVDMPNDSIGIDVKGKRLIPGTKEDFKEGALPNSALLEQGLLGNFLVFNAGPELSQVTEDDLHALVAEGELTVFETISD